jgi:Cell differentiation family, Rcd1-like
MPALLQEIVSVYPLLSPPNLTAHVSNRVCNALALLQCVASHSETRQLFLNGVVPYFCFLEYTINLIGTSPYTPLLVSLSQHHLKNTPF